MTTAVGQTLPGAAVAGAAAGHSATKGADEGPAFRDMLSQGKPHRTGTAGERDAARHAEGKKSEPIDAEGVPDAADPGDGAPRQEATPLRDRLSLLATLREFRPRAGRNGENDGNATGTSAEPQPDQPVTADGLPDPRQPVQNDGFPSPGEKGTPDASRTNAGDEPASTAATRRHSDRAMNSAVVGRQAPGMASAEHAAVPERGPVFPGMGDIEAAGEAVPAGGGALDDQSAARPSGATARGAALQRVTVVAEQNFPAPAAYPVSRTASELATAIASDSGWRQAVSAASLPLHAGTPSASPAHALKIELHPAELGAVVANLRMAGEQLTIEIRPETYDAYRKLSADSEALVKSLRGLGFDIDKVTVLQPSLAATPAARADAAAQMPLHAGRDHASPQPGGNGGGEGAGGQQPGRNRNDEGQDHGRAASQPRERTGGGLFI